MAFYTAIMVNEAGGRGATMAMSLFSEITSGMVPGGITGTGDIRAIGEISIGIIGMASIGIMAIVDMMPGEITGGGVGIMAAI
jgi:hypothetical protein